MLLYHDVIMRIIIYTYNYHPEPIGIAPLMTELAENLVKRGHEVRVLTAMPWYPEGKIHPKYKGKLFLTESHNEVKIQRCYIWTRRKRSLLNRVLFEISFVMFSLFQAFQSWRPDVIFMTVPGLPVSVCAAILGFVYQCPIVLNLQDILPDAAVHVGLINNKILIQMLSYLEKFAYRTASKISVITDGFTKNIIAKGVASEKIVRIPNWVDINFIKPLSKENNYFLREQNLENKFVVLYSGNIALTQRLETVIEAAAKLQHLDKIAVVIVGAEKALAKLRKYCQHFNISNVHLCPFQPRAKLPEMLAAADIGLVVQQKNVIDFNMPSKIPLLLASGRVIIASVPSNSNAASVINKSGGGIVVPPESPEALAEAIESLYYNQYKAIMLGINGRLYAESNYALESVLDKYEKLLTLVNKNNGMN